MRTHDRLSRRIRVVRRDMARLGLGALLVSDRANVRYLTGFTGTAGLALLTPDRLTLIVDFRYFEQAALEAGQVDRVHVEKALYDAAVARAISEAGVGRVAFEAEATTFAGYLGLTSRMPAVDWVPCRGVVESARLIKDEGEIRLIRRAAAIVSEAVGGVMATVAAGMTEREVAAAIDARMVALGAERPAFDTLVASGARTALPHPRPGPRRIEPGDWVLIDAGAMVEGYRSDMTRSFTLGPPNDEQRRALAALGGALAAGLAAIGPGRSAKGVDAACRRALARHGLAAAFGHDSGHGVGLDLHEGPRLAVDEDEVLAPGMVVTVEPGVYFPGVGGARLEELVLITEAGHEVLTTAPLELHARADRR